MAYLVVLYVGHQKNVFESPSTISGSGPSTEQGAMKRPSWLLWVTIADFGMSLASEIVEKGHLEATRVDSAPRAARSV